MWQGDAMGMWLTVTYGCQSQRTVGHLLWLQRCAGCVIPHYSDVTMDTMASQITSLTIVYSTVYSSAHQRKHQSSKPLAFVRGIHRRPVNSPHKGPVTRKMFPFNDVIMIRILPISFWRMGRGCGWWSCMRLWDPVWKLAYNTRSKSLIITFHPATDAQKHDLMSQHKYYI